MNKSTILVINTKGGSNGHSNHTDHMVDVSSSSSSSTCHPSLGPLHTRATSRDHEIVRAQKKVSKGRPNTLPKSCSVVMDPQV